MLRCATVFTSALVFTIASISLVGAAERPPAPRLMPKETLGYVRIADAVEMRESMAASSIGRMLEDEQLKPLVSEVYQVIDQLFSRISEQVGVSLDELLSLPQGEVAIAVVPMGDEPEADSDKPRDNSPEAIRARIEARRNRSPVGVVGLIETGEKSYVMRTLLERFEAQMQNAPVQRSTQDVDGTEVVTYRRGNTPVSYCEKDGTFLFAVGPGLLEQVLDRWEGGDDAETLAQNTDFGNVMSHCVGAEETRPQLTFFFDPYHLVERIVKANGGAAGAVWPILESLQLDKIKGIGGSSFSSAESDFESIIHLHLLLETPRDGLLSVIRPGEGSTQPEDWVPDDLTSYSTLHWDLEQTYEGVGRILSRFQGDGALERVIEEPFKQRTEVDLRADVIEQLTGRVSIARWNQPPMRLNSATQLWALEVKEIGKLEPTIEGLMKQFSDAWNEDTYAGKTLYSIEPRRTPPPNLRTPTPTLAIVGNYVMISDSRKAVEHMIDTLAGRHGRLSASPDYELIAGEVSGKLDAEQPFLFSFIRGEEALRPFYEMARDPANRQLMRQAAESNPTIKLFTDALDKNELPAFSAFSKYFAPSGGFAYDDPTGLHYASFTLRPFE